MTVDLHQHVWTPSLLDALERRDALPFIRRRTDADDAVATATLHCAGERPSPIDLAAQAPVARARVLDAIGVRRAVVAISTPIGIEALPRRQALELIAAHLDGVLALGERFAAWGPVPIADPDPDDVDAVLARGCVGVSMPAAAIADAGGLARLAAVLERVQERGVPLFVHPGPIRGAEATGGDPGWWRALTDYVAQMQAAWLTFATAGRPRLPRLRVVFTMLAGGGPLLAGRLALRGGPPIDLADPLTFYETSGSGEHLSAAVADAVGRERLVYGSDRPVMDPPVGEDDALLMLRAARLLG
ncbi:MAG: amidohydrolase family protein [Solirubrobacteraceae bacterium]